MKRMSVVAFVAMAFLIFLIWKDPRVAADTFGGFLSAVGDFFGQLWQKLGDFFGNLAGSK